LQKAVDFAADYTAAAKEFRQKARATLKKFSRKNPEHGTPRNPWVYTVPVTFL